MENILLALSIFTSQNIMITLLGIIGGLLLGVIPGLSATMGMATLLVFTYKLSLDCALAAMIGIYVGAIYAGGITAILFNIPGTPAAAATCIDGYALTKKGEAGQAIGLATISSFIGEIFGETIALIFIPFIAFIAINFVSWEVFLLGVIGVFICGTLTQPEHPEKGWLTAVLGLLVGMVGIEELYGVRRLWFGNYNLLTGVHFAPAMIGLFGLSEVFYAFKKGAISTSAQSQGVKFVSILPRLSFLRKQIKGILRAGLIGVGIGAIPGLGESVSCWVSYSVAKRSSKTPEEFGKGSYEGIIAAEVANNATSGGALIPTLTIGIPGGAATALLLAAFHLHGVQPGPLLPLQRPELIYFSIFIFYVAAIGMVVFGLSLGKFLVKILSINATFLMPFIAVFTIIGSYSINTRLFDVYVAVFFGILGFVLKELDYPVAPMVLGIILGGLIDSNFRRAMQFSGGSIKYLLINRPIGTLLVFICLASVCWVLFKKFRKTGLTH